MGCICFTPCLLQFAAGVTSDDTESDVSGESDSDDDADFEDCEGVGVVGGVDVKMEVDSEGEGEANTDAGRVKSQHESHEFVDKKRCEEHDNGTQRL